MDKLNNCDICGESPTSFVTEVTGHGVICQCGNLVQGYKRKEWAIEQWNDLNF